MKMAIFLAFTVISVLIFSQAVAAQTTEFTYQGQLQESAVPANGNYDFEFRLFDALAGGNQIGATRTKNSVGVADGIFAVSLDFGASFPGANRFLEIRTRATGGVVFTTLVPRQPLTSTPYAIRSLNSASADTVVTLPTGSGNYIQNSAALQATSNFNISGNGTAGGTLSGDIVNAATQYNIGADRVLGSITAQNNLFVGVGAGQGNTVGVNNSFFGPYAGYTNTGGQANSFFGVSAGYLSTGSSNAFFGREAGRYNTTGSGNAFFGNNAGRANTTGGVNAFIGAFAGADNTTGSNNTAIGNDADVAAGNLTFATAIGAGAVATESNSVWLGRFDDIVYVPGFLRIQRLGGAGTTALCRNNADTIGPCSSSLRYKTNIKRFDLGLNLINQLKPITFDWKDGGMHDLGLGAEDVEAIEPLLVTYNQDGQVEGVKYDRIGVVLVNAVREQQSQIELQQSQIEAQQKLIDQQKAENESLNARIFAIEQKVWDQG